MIEPTRSREPGAKDAGETTLIAELLQDGPLLALGSTLRGIARLSGAHLTSLRNIRTGGDVRNPTAAKLAQHYRIDARDLFRRRTRAEALAEVDRLIEHRTRLARR